VPTSPKGRRHEAIREALAFRFARAAPEGVFVTSESQFNLADGTFVLPDLLVRPAAIRTPDLRSKDALLVIEVAETSLAYDRGMKARLFASHGVREYWVINATTLVASVHTHPSATGYGEVKEIRPKDLLSPSLVPAFAISLGTIELD
jgi:Uma2 family endonuclease